MVTGGHWTDLQLLRQLRLGVRPGEVPGGRDGHWGSLEVTGGHWTAELQLLGQLRLGVRPGEVQSGTE